MTGRRGGWWGVAFVVTLFVAGAMVSLPTATKGGGLIRSFYAAHATVVLVQQVLGIVTVGIRLLMGRSTPRFAGSAPR